MGAGQRYPMNQGALRLPCLSVLLQGCCTVYLRDVVCANGGIHACWGDYCVLLNGALAALVAIQSRLRSS